MALPAPTAVVVGATDPQATAAFLATFGFADPVRRVVDGALYGLDGTAETLEVTAAGRSRGRVRIVATPHPVVQRAAFDLGPAAIDVYSADLDASVRAVAAAGYAHGAVGTVELGPLRMRQCRVTGPDDLPVVVVEANRRRPSLLDDDGDALHSEVHSVVWAVDDAQAAGTFWTAQAGLHEQHLVPINDPAVSAVMGLPRDDVALRMSLLSDDGVSPVRLELLEFVDDPGVPAVDWPLRAGVHGLLFGVREVATAAAGLASVRWDCCTAEGASGVEPGGVRLLLEPA